MYPIIRLPREFRELAGSTAKIYQAMYEGKLAFLVATDHKVGNGCTTFDETQDETRLSALEYEIRDLKKLILQGGSYTADKTKKQRAEGEIRTRVVASTVPF
ncbi:MAG: hypothetical protein ACXVIX_09970 [Halobacteriota archaeon]